ncbi:MAG TPA: hypothetical protein VHL54_02260 [Actinomycetota bacterium]|nr:hypothetical protein [Actinomycetota bacterium]
MRRALLGTIAAAALLLTACADAPVEEDSSPTPASESTEPASPTAGATTGSPAAAGGGQWSTCEHPEGVVVSYPAGWQVNQGGALPACSAFDPAALEIPAGQETFDAAVLLSVDPVDFAAAVDPETISGEVLDRSEAFVDGHDAVRVETRSEANALLPEGGRSTRWFVVFGRESTLSLVTHEVGSEDDYETERQILDQMVERLQLPADS